jgi:hypothetical protein
MGRTWCSERKMSCKNNNKQLSTCRQIYYRFVTVLLNIFFVLLHILFTVLSSIMTFHQINTTGATSGARNAYPSREHELTPEFSVVRVTRSLVLCVCFVYRCLSFFFWPLCCLFFFYLRILITTLISSSSS